MKLEDMTLTEGSSTQRHHVSIEQVDSVPLNLNFFQVTMGEQKKLDSPDNQATRGYELCRTENEEGRLTPEEAH